MSGIKFDETCKQCMNSKLSPVLITERKNPTRAGFVNVYLDQANSLPCNTSISGVILTPKYNEKLHVMSDKSYYMSKELMDVLLGFNLFAVFVKLELTYKDGIVISRSTTRRFKYNAKLSIYLDP